MMTSPTLLVHWARQPTDDELREVLRRNEKDQVTFLGRQVPANHIEHLVQQVHLGGLDTWGKLGMWFPHPREPPVGAANQTWFVNILFPFSEAVPIRPHGPKLDFFAKNPGWGWVKLSDELDPEQDFEVTWGLSKLRTIVELLPIDWAAFSDNKTFSKFLHGGGDPRSHAWPLTITALSDAQRKQLEGLVEDEVVRLERLPEERWWVQLTENPFQATKAQVASLADALGLQPAPVGAKRARPKEGSG